MIIFFSKHLKPKCCGKLQNELLGNNELVKIHEKRYFFSE